MDARIDTRMEARIAPPMVAGTSVSKVVFSDDEDDDGSPGAASASPAPAGTVAPPANGLFGSGAMPKVKVN